MFDLLVFKWFADIFVIFRANNPYIGRAMKCKTCISFFSYFYINIEFKQLKLFLVFNYIVKFQDKGGTPFFPFR